MMVDDKGLLFSFAYAIKLAEMAGTNVEITPDQAKEILRRIGELERACDELTLAFLEAEEACEKLKAWAYMMNGGEDVEQLSAL